MLGFLVNPKNDYKYAVDKINEQLFLIFDYLNSASILDAGKIANICNNGIKLCNMTSQKAKFNCDEIAANSLFVIKEYLIFYQYFSQWWNQINIEEYESSWFSLQDSFDALRRLKKFTSDYALFYMDFFDRHLTNIEKLYPYKVFSSVEMVIKRSTCNICGKDTLDPDCLHIPGHLYWGEIAYMNVIDAELKAVAMVANPLDKRCILTLPDDHRPNSEKFKALDFFAHHIKSPLQSFNVVETTRRYSVDNYYVGRNELCPCGSRKKFKHCCLPIGYIEKPHLEITFSKTIKLEPYK